jgi:hypothetical protein
MSAMLAENRMMIRVPGETGSPPKVASQSRVSSFDESLP